MIQNKIHCLIINDSKDIKSTLAQAFKLWEDKVKVKVETVGRSPSDIIKRLIKNNIDLIFTSSNEKKQLEEYRVLLRRYSIDTILVNQSVKSRPLLHDLSGIESCSIHFGDANTPILIDSLLSYTLIKSKFRHCKHLLSITDKRNRWLVNITPEPIAYLYKGTHIHANAAYLSIFGFQSVSELKSVSIWGLVPIKSQNMFKMFIKKQRRQLDMQQTLLMTMNTADKTTIRTGVRIAPAVINKTKCLQLWIHKIEDNLEKKEHQIENKPPVSPWEEMPKKTVMTPLKSPPSEQSNIQLKQKINMIELMLQPLTDTNTSSINHFLVSLELDSLKQSTLTKELKKSGIKNTFIFWDRLLFTNLSKKLMDKNQNKNQFLLLLTEASITCNDFINFLITTIKNLPNKHSHLVFLIPAHLLVDPDLRIKKLRKTLDSMNCSLGIQNFIPNRQSIRKVLVNKPSYLSFSNKWVKSQTNNKKNSDRFNQLTQRIESVGIQVILSSV